MSTTDTPWTDGILSTREVDDDTATELALCELLQRRWWALELGLDPDHADLLALPSVGGGMRRAA